ncbi:hypothetical protein GCM10009083_24710 [Halopseudomonas pertucinogena]|uniref:DUF4105 domain-containing protein n=1 Tax=Halopseudomonas pertucinogena TaxID=86175 RepID=A0ABQ2CRT6_9GAMM|nr:hypothetical protein GCM10009083_24710 [Halopseudomonas pertucinogena]
MSFSSFRWQRRVASALLVTLFLSIPPAQAALQLVLDGTGLTAEQRQASQALLDATLDSLPPLMRETLGRHVPVRWTHRLPEQVIGRASPSGRLLLNARWLEGLTGGPVSPAGRLMHATLIHELTHFYDQQRAWSDAERRLIRACNQRQQIQGDIGLPAECRGQVGRRHTLSDDPRWLDLAGWPQRVGTRGDREAANHQRLRSPDPYEFTNPQEFLAVNMEHFLLDPQYACRRPALAAHLRQHFGWSPAADAPCSALPYVNAALDGNEPPLGWLDPKRLYQAHYLLAEADHSWAGRWGHSMLRLVICAPGREPGPDCMLDLQHHLVLSYRAFVDDVQLSSWDGLTGVYPSRLFILPLQRVIDEYTRTELRTLSSVPLQLTPEQLQGLAHQAATQHWSYDGTYYFVNNNCAVETLKLLRSGSNHPQLIDLDSQTPYGLLRLLESRGLADARPLRDPVEALRLGYRFDSYRERYEQLFSIVRSHLQIPSGSFSEWLALTAEQRQPWLKPGALPPTAALLVLENAALRQHLQHIKQDLKLRFLSGREGMGALQEAGELMSALLTESAFLSRPADLLPTGYGLPQPEEAALLEETASTRRSTLLEMTDSLEQQVEALLLPEQKLELDRIKDNITLLGDHLRQLHRQSGGLEF